MTKEQNYLTLDGNEAVAHVAYRVNEVIAIYPITPSSPMGEWADAWAAKETKNIWGTVPTVVEMQSEGGAAGAVHGSLQAGSMTTTFTASQGLLLMIPNMYKIAGELTPTVFHVAARSIAAQGLSIFGDHSDVMSARQTGWASLCSASVQEAMDFALISQRATLASRIPFIHFFDGFRTSHEVSKVSVLSDEDIRSMIDDSYIQAHRDRSLCPDHPVIRGTAQNPDAYFQARETVNPFYVECANHVEEAMEQFGKMVGRNYKLYEYHGAEKPDRLIIMMGSGCETAHENGENVGLIKVRLFRPFDMKRFVASIPASVKTIAVLDRTKEPGSSGEPLYLDCLNAIHEGINDGTAAMSTMPKILGGRYGLSSKEFTPAMVKGVFDHIGQDKAKNHFTVGIEDDVSNTSISYDPSYSTASDKVVTAMFYGLGSDGTVGANKNSIKIIGENTENYAQGYFVYDSKKAGAVTVSHLRFGTDPIRSTYLIDKAQFVACHQGIFLDRYDMWSSLKEGGTFLLNSPMPTDKVWDTLPKEFQTAVIDKKLALYTIDADTVAKDSGMGRRINTIMQVCFFAISGVLPKERAIEEIKEAIRKTYGKKGDQIVAMNLKAVDNTLEHLHQVTVPDAVSSTAVLPDAVSSEAPEFVRDVLGKMMSGHGDSLPVSSFPVDGTYPTATTKWEKRNLADEIPVWESDICIQCGKCAFVCPHAAIRLKSYEPEHLEKKPSSFKSVDSTAWKGMAYTIQVAPEDCTGCTVCVEACPAKDKNDPERKAINMKDQAPILEQERANWDFFEDIPDMPREKINPTQIRQQQAQRPLFEFSGACAGCGETAYVKLVSQLFGDRTMIANATGCSSIYGGNLPTTPWSQDAKGRGPSWSNSLFEDNAEFGLGMRISVDKQTELAREYLTEMKGEIGSLADDILNADQKDDAGINAQRDRVDQLIEKLSGIKTDKAETLKGIANYLVKKSTWIMGGDGWAYDIGYGGLDHVLASGRNVNILVMDTEVYSNTGGQMSKATPRAAIAKFAAAGKPAKKKDLGLIAMSYGNVYVASVAMGAKDAHTLKAFIEAEAYDGPSLIIAYSHCIAHGIDLKNGMESQKAAVETGQWLLYRYNPMLAEQGKNPLILDSKKPKRPVQEYLEMENRFRQLTKLNPARYLNKFRWT